MAIGRKTGGRAKGTPNKATVEREILAMQAVVEKARTAKPSDLKLAVQEMQKALKLAEGFASALQPKITKDANSNKITIEGDIDLFGKWFDRWVDVMSELATYQAPKIKAMEAPTPPPDPAELEAQRNAPPRKRFTLRIFEGGKLVKGPAGPGDAEAS